MTLFPDHAVMFAAYVALLLAIKGHLLLVGYQRRRIYDQLMMFTCHLAAVAILTGLGLATTDATIGFALAVFAIYGTVFTLVYLAVTMLLDAWFQHGRLRLAVTVKAKRLCLSLQTC